MSSRDETFLIQLFEVVGTNGNEKDVQVDLSCVFDEKKTLDKSSYTPLTVFVNISWKLKNVEG